MPDSGGSLECAARERMDLLRLHVSTRGLDDQQLHRIALHTAVLRLREGEFAQRRNEPIDNLLLVVLGQLGIIGVAPTGAKMTALSLGPNEEFGLLATNEASSLRRR